MLRRTVSAGSCRSAQGEIKGTWFAEESPQIWHRSASRERSIVSNRFFAGRVNYEGTMARDFNAGRSLQPMRRRCGVWPSNPISVE